jgi:DNA-binding protein H-NS
MPDVDLSALTLEELEQLRKAIETEKQQRQKAERERILHEARAAAARYGMSVAQFLQPRDKKRRAAAAPRYRNPQNPKQVWNGRGKQPAWVQQALDAGSTMTDLEAAAR